jgi:hypothetical protein
VLLRSAVPLCLGLRHQRFQLSLTPPVSHTAHVRLVGYAVGAATCVLGSCSHAVSIRGHVEYQLRSGHGSKVNRHVSIVCVCDVCSSDVEPQAISCQGELARIRCGQRAQTKVFIGRHDTLCSTMTVFEHTVTQSWHSSHRSMAVFRRSHDCPAILLGV